MRITYFADIRFPLERANGIQTMETCHALAMRGHDVDLIVRPDTHTPPREPFGFYGLAPLPRLRVERAPVTGPALGRRLGYLAFAAGRAAGRGRADVVFTRDLGVAALLLRLPRALRPPVVYESHGYAPEVASALPQLVSTAAVPGARKLERLTRREALVWQRADGYVTITAALKADLVQRHGTRGRVAVIPDGVRTTNVPGSGIRDPGPGDAGSAGDEADSGFGIRDSRLGPEGEPGSRMRDAAPGIADAGTGSGTRETVVAYAGHLYPWKGVDVLLEALALVPQARGLIVGGHAAEPDLARVKALAEQLGVGERVTFAGMVEPARVADLLRSATVLALPNPESAISTRFTSPLKLFEYMAAGRPIVASDLPSIREVLHDETDALLVRPGDARAFAAAIRRLIEDPALASRLAAAARAAAPEYSWDRRAEKLEHLFDEAAGAR